MYYYVTEAEIISNETKIIILLSCGHTGKCMKKPPNCKTNL